jgi:hypothetical protein
MDDLVPFGGRAYLLHLSLLLVARAADLLSTWIATPAMVLEGNPIARKLGWRWGGIVNLSLCLLLGCWPLAAVIVSTTSLLVAARNFQSAWLMRTLGEEAYRDWYVERIQQARVPLYFFCLAGQVGLTAAVGGGLILFHGGVWIPLGIGIGVVAYAAAVMIYTLLAFWRIRRASST